MKSEEAIAVLKRSESVDASYLAAEPSLVYKSASGSIVFDADGKSYIDLCAGFGVLALGHHHPVHREVYRELTQDFAPVVHAMGDVYPSVDKAKLIERLLSLLPNSFSRVALALSGGQAVEMAVKTAVLKKPGFFVSFKGSYHGLDLGVLALTSRQDFRQGLESCMSDRWVLELDFQLPKEQILHAIEEHSQKTSLPLSAIIVEPIQGRAGVLEADVAWLQGLKLVCEQKQALLIYDEVFTGLARSGYWTTAELATCDLLCLGKALGGGLPLSALVGSEDAMSGWPMNTGEAKHTGTFFGHPLSCRMAEVSLNYMYDNDYPQISKRKGEVFRDLLENPLSELPEFECMRGRALMQGLVFRQEGFGLKMMDKLRELGVIALVSGKQAHVLSLTPAINISEEHMQQASELIVRAARELSY